MNIVITSFRQGARVICKEKKEALIVDIAVPAVRIRGLQKKS